MLTGQHMLHIRFGQVDEELKINNTGMSSATVFCGMAYSASHCTLVAICDLAAQPENDSIRDLLDYKCSAALPTKSRQPAAAHGHVTLASRKLQHQRPLSPRLAQSQYAYHLD